MRGRLILLAVAVSMACTLAAGVSKQAQAGGNAAAVIRADGQCLVSDNTGSWMFTCNIQFVIQPDGAITQYVTGSVIPGVSSSPLPSQAVTDIAGVPCLTLNNVVLTSVVAGVVTPSGQVKLTCRS
jgi:hypothetical protein